jgi:hypothetical protein
MKEQIPTYREFANAILNACLKEIEWCEENPDKELSKPYQRGFIKGMEQVYNHIIPPILQMFEEEKEQINTIKPIEVRDSEALIRGRIAKSAEKFAFWLMEQPEYGKMPIIYSLQKYLAPLYREGKVDFTPETLPEGIPNDPYSETYRTRILEEILAAEAQRHKTATYILLVIITAYLVLLLISS